MKLIESPNGSEKCLVNSLEGYDGWTVLAEGVSAPPPHCFWCSETNSWKVDAAAQAKAGLLAKVRAPEQLAELLADILARLPSGE